MNREMIDLYSDYLITNFGLATATGLSAVLNGELSHDQITRFLADQELTSKDYWALVKPVIRQIGAEDASISIDDVIVHKPHSDETSVTAYYFDHTINRTVKGMNIVDATYVTSTARVPLDFEVVVKQEYKVDLHGKPFRAQERSKHEMLERILRSAVLNQVPFKTVLFDVWYASAENMRLVKMDLGKEFIAPLKSNRRLQLLGDAGQGTSSDSGSKNPFKSASTLEFKQNHPYLARLEGVPFDVIVVNVVFKNEDTTLGELLLCSSATGLTGEAIKLGYQKRWPVEEQHKSAKQNTGLGSSPASSVISRLNHVFCSFVGVLKLECLKLTSGLNHFALRSKLRLKAVQAALLELARLRSAHLSVEQKPA